MGRDQNNAREMSREGQACRRCGAMVHNFDMAALLLTLGSQKLTARLPQGQGASSNAGLLACLPAGLVGNG